ncbi:MAG: glycosyltransferase, partial [Lactococcus lactis]|nr:glycosyltransferase [Lactococcus lactis]
MKEIDLSVIIPSYNVSQYVKKSIDSIKAQRGINYEIIVVDDGSTDQTLETLMDSYGKESNIKIISKKNQGSGIARNTGLDVARGTYVYFMDADDLIDEMMFKEIFNKIDSISYKPDMILFGFYSFYADSKVINHNYYKNKEFLI